MNNKECVVFEEEYIKGLTNLIRNEYIVGAINTIVAIKTSINSIPTEQFTKDRIIYLLDLFQEKINNN